jgi:hypothetical protein
VIFLVASACTHSDSYLVAPVGSSAPFITGTDVQLTYNVDQDYWPTWTQDGRGILYSFVDRNGPLHRCIGLLPAGGGSRLWEFCDNRGQRQDTVSSYTAYALDHTGRLLFSEADNMLNPEDLAPLPVVTLWLADTTNLLLRTRLLTLPVKVGTTTVSWFTDLAWLDSTTFIGLGQQFSSVPHCPAPPPSMVCPGRDSVFVDSGGVVLVGHLHGTQTTLDPITGTEGATGYALANGGTTVVFTFKHQLNLFTVPFGGGMIMPVPKLGVDSAFTQAGELLGVTCRSSDCVVAKGGVFLSGAYVGGCASPTCFDFGHYFSPDPIPMELHRVSLATGADEIVGLGSKNTVFATPMVSPVSGDVVVQVGGGWGHLQTFATSSGSDPLAPDGNSNLYRYHGLFP